MGIQIFPEPFYNRLLCSGERLAVTSDERFEILPRESFFSRLKRFLTFQQDPHIDKVHNLFKKLVEQADRAEGSHFQTLANEIHSHGRAKYKYLEANLIYLRKKLDSIGQLNWFSKLVLKVTNAVFIFFGRLPIQLRTYAIEYEENRLSSINRSFDFHRTSGNYTNPLEREGLKLTTSDENSCIFSSDSLPVKKEIQKLEKGLQDYYLIEQKCKNYNSPEMSTSQILANLEISFNPESRYFFAAINNPLARSIYNPFKDLDNKSRVNSTKISSAFAKHLRELPDQAKTFRYFVTALSPDRVITQHELMWNVQPTEQAPFELNQGSQPFILRPGTQYKFYDEQHQMVGLFKVTLNPVHYSN